MKNEFIYKADEGTVTLHLRYGRSPDVEVREVSVGDLTSANEVENLLARMFVEGVRHKALSDAHASTISIKKMMKEVDA